MFIQLVLLSSLLCATSSFGASSEIPLKREFPLNDKINPCENLYEHACSKTIESFQLRADRRRHSFAFSDSAERILEFKKNYIKDLTSKEADSPVSGQIKNFYLSCMNKDARAKEETNEIQKLMDDQKKITDKKEWFKTQAGKIHSGKSGFIGYSTNDNFDDARKSDLMLGVGYSLLPEKSYAKNEVLIKALAVLVTDFFKTIGADHPEERAKTVLKYEIDQQDNRFFPVEARIAYSLRRFVTKKELLKKYPDLQLNVFLSQIPEATFIRNMNPKTIPFLNKIAKTYSLDELKTLEMFYELRSKLDQGYPTFYDEAFVFANKFLGGKNKRSELDEECTTLTMHRFGAEFDYLVLPKMFPNFSSEKVADLVGKIKKSILASLSKNTWLSPTAKKEAERKISTAFMRLVSPQNFTDWKFLPTAAYGKDTYLANIEKRNGISETREFKFFRELKDIRSWEGVEPLEVNAFYQPSYNQFTMLQGILQYPFYDQKSSEIENLAGVGMVVGHELGHAIDDQGSKYDADGKLRDWMTAKDLVKFKELTKSLIEQYSKAGMNGEYTLGENIGDLVGLNAAYDAAFSTDNTASASDLKSQKKNFFLNYARSWCEVQLPGVRDLRLKSDPHSLGVARVNEVVKHFASFKEAFDCKDSDPMIFSAEQRVHIW
ncbi:MAG: M13 family metallopeptidase [Bacteriovorax sp.]|nr:M13 family metallopeptidase [Bacteriovorax sp.]